MNHPENRYGTVENQENAIATAITWLVKMYNGKNLICNISCSLKTKGHDDPQKDAIIP